MDGHQMSLDIVTWCNHWSGSPIWDGWPCHICHRLTMAHISIYIYIQCKCVCASSGIGTSASSKSLIQPANPNAYHANTNRYTHSVTIWAKVVEREVMCAEGGIFFRNPLPPLLPWGPRHYPWLPHCELLTIPTESQVTLTRKNNTMPNIYIYI